MRSILRLVSAILLLTSPCFAALSTDANSALSFYRSRTSLFPSGQASRNALEETLMQSEIEFSFRVSWDKKAYDLEADHLLRDIQTASYVETKGACELLKQDRRNSGTVKVLSAKTSLELLEAQSYWGRVRDSAANVEGWVPLHLLQAKNEDPGVYVNLIDSYLRKKPDLGSGIITTIPRLRRIVPLNIENGYLRVNYENQIGFVDINNFVSRADFANLAFAKNKGWVPVSHRNGDKLVTKSGEEIHLNNIIGYVTNSHRGVIISASGNKGPQLRSRVEILNQQANIWGYSKVDGHGNVWWKKTDLLVEAEIKSPTTITTDELMKREIYSIAFENKNSVRGIVSSEGVYRTDDGLTWTLIPQFGKQNSPVNIHPNGTWFVGSYKSTNKGKSFDPFIRWDLITQAIESSYHMNPRMLRLTQIEAMPDSQVQIYVDTGISKIKLRGALHGATWNVVR